MWPFGKREVRAANIESPDVALTPANMLSYFGVGGTAATGEAVTIDSALGVPAVWSAVNFIAGTMASLPLHVFRKTTEGGREKDDGPLSKILGGVVNESLVTSFQWRKTMFQDVLTGGRHVSFIERNAKREVVNLWPLDPSKVTLRRTDFKVVYEYKVSDSKTYKYEATEVLDLVFYLKPDGLSQVSPILSNRDVIGLAQASVKYGSRFFQNGGVPPFVVTGGFQSSTSMDQAASDLEAAVKKATKDSRQALVLPSGLEVKELGTTPDKAQLVELQRFLIEQVARIYSLPPVFLQDLSHGTYSNTEQQDLHFVKHTLRRWVGQFEQELNAKLFGRDATQFVALNVDGILRGDFKTRMEGYAQGVQSAVLTPNEARRFENRDDKPEGNHLMINSASVPVAGQIKAMEGGNDA